MKRKLGKILVIAIIIHLIVFQIILSVHGDLPVVASRISGISNISVIADHSAPNDTLFGISVEVEILNRADENQTVIELSDFRPNVFINATFVNQSLEIDPLACAHATIMRYSYQPGITSEGSLVKFYINQANLTYLPDGNYTLWRLINTAYIINNITSEELPAIITVSSGIVNITYIDFDYIPTEITSFSFIFPIVFLSLFSLMVSLYIRRKSSITKYKN